MGLRDGWVPWAMRAGCFALCACGGNTSTPTDAGDGAANDAVVGGGDADASQSHDAAQTDVETGSDADAGAVDATDASPIVPLDCDGGLCVLATMRDDPEGIVVAGGALFWTDYARQTGTGKIMTCSLPDCAGGPRVVADNRTALSLATDGTYVAWGNATFTGAVEACMAPACVPTTMAQGNYPFGVAISGGIVYWATGSFPQIDACSLTGACQPQMVASLPTFGSNWIAAGGGYVVWDDVGALKTDSCAVSACDADAGSATTLGPYGCNYGLFSPIAIDGTDALWQQCGIVERCALSGCGGNPTAMNQAPETSAAGFVVQGGKLFIADGDVLECPSSGCGASPKVLAANAGAVAGIAVDATYVYFTTALGGQVLRVAR